MTVVASVAASAPDEKFTKAEADPDTEVSVDNRTGERIFLELS